MIQCEVPGTTPMAPHCGGGETALDLARAAAPDGMVVGIEQDDNSKKSHHALERLPLEEIRADIRLFLDRIVVAIDAVGDQRVARENRILVELDRVQADDSSLFGPIPFERRRALRLLAGRNRVGEHKTLNKGLHRLQPRQRLPVHVERAGKARDEQDEKPDCNPLEIHLAPASLLEWHSHQPRQPFDAEIAGIVGPHRDAENDRRNHCSPDQIAAHPGHDRRTGLSAGCALAVLVLTAHAKRQRQKQHDPPQNEVDSERGCEAVGHASFPILTFVFHRGELSYECKNRETSPNMNCSAALDLTFATNVCGSSERMSNPPHYSCSISTRAPEKSFGWKNNTGLPWAPIL